MLSTYEKDILANISPEWQMHTVTRNPYNNPAYDISTWKAQGYAVIQHDVDGITFGAIRCRVVNAWHRDGGSEDYWEIENAGMIYRAPISHILAVRETI